VTQTWSAVGLYRAATTRRRRAVDELGTPENHAKCACLRRSYFRHGLLNLLALNDPVFCGGAIANWSLAGATDGLLPVLPYVYDVNNDIDRRYANAFLNYGTGNKVGPPPQIPSATLKGLLDLYRVYSRFQAAYEVTNGVIANPQYLHSESERGLSLEPCTGLQLDALSPRAELHQGFDGLVGASQTLVYHLTEGRIGPEGQAVNRYLNWRNFQDQSYTSPSPSAATPYIWVATVFDINGNMRPLESGTTSSTVSVYSSFAAYMNPDGVTRSEPTKQQEDLEIFIAKNALYVLNWPPL
jgi:hypothetical protein